MPQPASFWAELPLGREVAVLIRDANGLAGLHKPAGLLSLPNTPAEQGRSLLQASYRADQECYEWPGGKLWLLNRLDSATSGVILVADNAALAAVIRDHFKRKQVHKLYQALVFGRPARKEETWIDRLASEKKGGQIRTGAGHIPSESRMRVIKSFTGPGGAPLALIQLEPRTGRSHQLRVQCAKRHLPIVGDQTYGDFGQNRAFAKLTGEKRLFLHSRATRFSYTLDGREHSFAAEAPLPREFKV
jgi:23S rRNA-/tRNA-specific pseudouridylate synthase